MTLFLPARLMDCKHPSLLELWLFSAGIANSYEKILDMDATNSLFSGADVIPALMGLNRKPEPQSTIHYFGILVQDRCPMAEAAGEAINPLSNIQPKHFVLVHGACHGAWCWFKLRNLLEEAGNKVTCLDLAGAGIDLSDPSSILTFDDYNKPLFDFMSALPDGHKVILVGHSAGGLSVCHSLQNFDDKIEVAIFVAATMLRSGFCTEEDAKAGVPDLPKFVDAYSTKFSLGSDKPPTTVAFSEDVQRELLYQLSPVEDAVLASMLVRPSPSQALGAAKFEGKISEVKRIYIRTTYDNMLTPEQQDAMIKMWPPYEMFPIDTDHSPFFSAPQRLFELIVRASASAI